MRVAVGIDLGSTTSKAVVLDERGQILGRGITNSRSNYDVAADIARTEAFIQARFSLLRARISAIQALVEIAPTLIGALAAEFRLTQIEQQLGRLGQALQAAVAGDLEKVVAEIVPAMRANLRKKLRFESRPAGFFRDLAASEYMGLAQAAPPELFDRLVTCFDKAIAVVDNAGIDLSFEANIDAPFARVRDRLADRVGAHSAQLEAAIAYATTERLEVIGNVGTGYGRARLPFPKEQIRSEILCHGLGAHRMFPHTRTVLDIGGQDTKAIQLDGNGVVSSFQMNDRCAAGCGRYLGYIADEMNLGLHELGPMAEQSCHPVRINSTCTVFAGAELRDRLGLGQKREDILAGLHRAIILRAMSLLARSGGVRDAFTFTGGVANNTAAVSALRTLTQENYGEVHLNISPDSIFTGALGAATFALRDAAARPAAEACA